MSLELKVVMQNYGDFVDVILLYFGMRRSLTRNIPFSAVNYRVSNIDKILFTNRWVRWLILLYPFV